VRTAFLVDGGFFLTRYQRLKGNAPPRRVARSLHAMCLEHLRQLGRSKDRLYRIFYYDCPPLTKKVHNPISGQAIDFSKTPTAIWRNDFFAELKKMRKVALRLGYLDERNGHWALKPGVLKRLAKAGSSAPSLTADDVKYDVRQKGVDMKLGLDIASMAFKQQVDQMVLVSGDSDFVAAAKLARREGIDFILDPMWHPIREDLHEHIDGLQGVFKRSQPTAQQSIIAVQTIAAVVPVEPKPKEGGETPPPAKN
jgi:uncharacterized LabA/DUF88 family protein